MSEPTITCPACRTEIRLTESLAAPLLESTRRGYEERLREERTRIAAEESQKAAAALADDLSAKGRELAELRELLLNRDAKLAEAQKAQAGVLRQQRELDDARRELELTIEQRVSGNLAQLREQARREVEGQLGLKLAEREQTIAAMQKQVEELKRKAEQGSEQLKGEVQELELEATLAGRFPLDTITPVLKGRHGGDVLQSVHSPLGQSCGAILWEAKRTRHWSEGWLPKLRGDQRAAKADLAVIISQALPPDVDSFALVDDVWVAHPSVAIPLASALRQSLVELALARQAGEGQQTKMALVYQYLTSPAFRQRVQAIVEAFTMMQKELDQEKRVLMKQWAKREAQIDRVMQATVGMYGDLQGIAGRSLQEIDGLELAALEGPDAAGVVDDGDSR